MINTELEYSISPNGEKFQLPLESEFTMEFNRLKELADTARSEGKEVVVVMGIGFVGSVMAGIVADTEGADGKPSKFVIGCDLPAVNSYWKIKLMNRGEPPVQAEDKNVDLLIERVVNEKKTLTATFNNDCLKLADCVVVDVQCDFHKSELGNMRSGAADIQALRSTLVTIGEKIPENCLVLIETTVAPGTTEFIALPLIKKAFKERGLTGEPLLAHSYERVMPGKDYFSSVRDYWRVCAGCNDESRTRVETFLNQVLNTEEFPLTVMDRPIESETSKIIENSYRATILAFLNEWSLFSERNGVDLIKVIKAIKKRPTHSNIIFPGPGVGGYCLPKDGGLGYWAYKNILGFDDADEVFKITPTAIDINDTRALHVAELTRDALRNMGRNLAGTKVLLCGASYRQDVGDTRYSGSEIIVRRLTELGVEIKVHDPYIQHWNEFENQPELLARGYSWAKFFTNQESLVDLKMEENLCGALEDVQALIIAVPHEQYMDMDPDKIVSSAKESLAVIDCFGILSDAQIKRYFELDCEVKALGRGHIQRIKESVRKNR